MRWPTVTVTTPEGDKEAIAPLIISASRSTDIPAFHAEWLIRRLDAGYCKWVNPFNGRPQYVSFERARAFVFWTKNAEPLMGHLGEFDRRGIAYYFQFTLNDYEEARGTEGLERNVPPLSERVRTFRRLAEVIGRQRVIWRFDPLLLTDTITVGSLVEKVRRVGEMVHEHTEKLVISFADVQAYAKVQRNLRKWGGGAREFRGEEVEEVAGRVAELAKGWGLRVATCCERVDLGRYGIEHNKCIDDELLLRVSGGDPELQRFLRPSLKDPGQREDCGCAASKDIGAYNTCPHLCAYCYANTSALAVRNAVARACGQDETICP